MKYFSLLLIITSLLYSCSSKKRLTKNLERGINSSTYQNQFTGVLFVDAHTKDTVYSSNSKKYFTPASNTKIFTLYASLEIIPDYIPALKYINKNDTLYFEGTGDPSLLHLHFKDSTAISFLKKAKTIAFATNNFTDTKFGPGWAWDDFLWYYAPERNALPIHGNVVLSYKDPQLKVSPAYFKDSVLAIKGTQNRKPNKNLFYHSPNRTTPIETPFITSIKTTKGILENELHKSVLHSTTMPVGDKKTLYGIASDSLYKRMMHESDNFIAEQLLMVASSVLKDSLNSKITRNYILENQLKDLSQTPRWVDGSGLSRYNLFTPESMVHVLSKLYAKIPSERLFKLFPIAGVSGTLKEGFSSNAVPYIYAKSGSLSNNYCLSGYLLTKSGRTIIFSFMNNHFQNSTTDIKASMQLIFDTLRNTY